MHLRLVYISFSLMIALILLPSKSHAKAEDVNESHIITAMRTIGHKILLATGDSTSLVLPIKKIEDRYKIEFESDFQFFPNRIVSIVDEVIKLTGIADDYLVEVEQCDSHQIVYSYEVRFLSNSDLVACQTRDQPLGCYEVFITILKPGISITEQIQMSTHDEDQLSIADQSNGKLYLWLVIILAVLGFILFSRKPKPEPSSNSDLISIGQYQFDKKNMALSIEDNVIELTSKEADLLVLLHQSANTTLERDVILQMVWGDEGDYIGRTLDVFISKLRKKLASDDNLRIINIRGVGYKLIVN